MTDRLANYVPGFGKSHEIHHSFMMVLEKRKGAIDKGDCVSAILMELSKAFETINRDVMIAKLKSYGFSEKALNLLKESKIIGTDYQCFT